MRYTIIMRSERTKSGWEELGGHGCYSIAEMQKYCQAFDKNYGTPERWLKIVPLPFDDGGFNVS